VREGKAQLKVALCSDDALTMKSAPRRLAMYLHRNNSNKE